jgi:hypothetical protein
MGTYITRLQTAASDEETGFDQTNGKLRSKEIECHILLIFTGLTVKMKCAIAACLVR